MPESTCSLLLSAPLLPPALLSPRFFALPPVSLLGRTSASLVRPMGRERSCVERRPLRVGVVARATTPTGPLWLLVVAQLDRTRGEYSISDLAALLQLGERAVRKHARSVWPHRTGHYRLTWGEACVLLNYICCRSERLDSGELFVSLRRSGLLDADWRQCAWVAAAQDVVLKHRRAHLN